MSLPTEASRAQVCILTAEPREAGSMQRAETRILEHDYFSCYIRHMTPSPTETDISTESHGNKKRWAIYGLVGIVFGVFDYFFQQNIPSDASSITRVAIFYGIWLVLLVPIALYEVRKSHSELKTALACASTWSVAIVAYYLYMAIELVIIGKDARPELHFSNFHDPDYWTNLGQVFLGDVTGGIVEWIMLAIVGGGMLGLVISFIYKTLLRHRASTN